MEIWKDCYGYEDLFQISNTGKVYSKRSNKVLKTYINHGGYEVFSTKIGGRKGHSVCLRVNRLVALTFIDNPENKPEVNHKDGDKGNNNDWNLEWSTRNENTDHATEMGLYTGVRGEENIISKLTVDDVLYIRDNYKSGCRVNGIRALARKFNVSHTTVRHALWGITWEEVLMESSQVG